MNNRSIYLLLILALVALAGFFIWKNSQGPVRYDWRDSFTKEAYSETSNQPYGTQVFYRLLANYFPAHQRIDISKELSKALPLDSVRQSSYVFVGEGLYLDSLSTARLLGFVKAGNTALLSSKTIPFDLMFYLYYEECAAAEWNDYELYQDTTVVASVRLASPQKPVRLHYAEQNQVKSYRWSYIESRFFCPGLAQQPLGFLNDTLVNFAVFPHGKGRFLLHTTPIAFSNYQLLSEDTRQYAAQILSYLPSGTIYWDTYSRVPEAVARRRNRSRGYSRQLPTEHPLSYILQQTQLAWAWYLLLGLAAIYVVFRAKRRQRIIPVLAKNENSSFEFISTIANLHFKEKNYQNLCVQNMRLFLAQLRDRYGMMTQLDAETRKPRIDQDFIQRLSQVSEVPVQQIQDIFTQYTAAVQYEPTEEMMTQLHLSMEAFFKRAK